MLGTFANRMTGYFAALLIASMTILFLIWYFGVPAINLTGAKTQELETAISLLEIKADLHEKLISTELNERRGGILVLAESDGLINNIVNNHAALQEKLNIKFQSLLRAYPRRYKKLLIIKPQDLSIIASTEEVGQVTIFQNNEFFNKAVESNHNELIDSWVGSDGRRILALAHKIRQRNEKGDLYGPVQGVLIAVIDINNFFEDGFSTKKNSMPLYGNIVITNNLDNEILAIYPLINNEKKLKDIKSYIKKSYIGTKIEKGLSGKEVVAVYRELSIGNQQSWSIIHFVSKKTLLAGLHENVSALFWIGLSLMFIVLTLIKVVSSRLTSPLKKLAKTASRLGRGNLYVRSEEFTDESHEIKVLSQSFNEMAASIQNSQQLLEDKVINRTEKLRRAEAMHSTLFNASVDAVIVMNNREIIDCNPSTLIIFGADDKSQILNHQLVDFLSVSLINDNSQEFTQVEWERNSAIMQNDEHYFMHKTFCRLDNQEQFDAEIQINRVNHAGQLLFQATIRDITLKKRIEDAIHESEMRHRTLVEWSPEGIHVHRHGRIIYVNASAVKMLRFQKAEQLIGHHIVEFIHPFYHFLLDNKAVVSEKEGTYFPSIEAQFICGDGEIIDVVVQTIKITFDGEKSYYTAWRDVTELKKNAEKQRIAATVFESQEGMLVIDHNWKILRINQSFCLITGYTSEEIIGKPPYFLDDTLLNLDFIDDFYKQIQINGIWQGELINRRKSGELFPAWLNISSVKDEDGNATHYVGTFSDITKRKAIEDEIRNLAFYDQLTKLPNRRLLIDRLKQAIAISVREGRKGALLFIDLDNFKMLNDTLGHDKGDLLLAIVAERLLLCTREGDTVARLGGDEFVVMLENLSVEAFEASRLAEIVSSKIIEDLNQPYWLGINEHHSSPSIGVTLFGDHLESIEEPLKRADLAMYQAKSAGRNTVRFFDPMMQAKVNERAELEESLRDAMLSDQFELYYQAQMTNKNDLFGAEVLIRWKHPVKGIISPMNFIPLAEENGLISIIGYWVIDTVCKQLVEWETSEHLKNICISVNVSPNQFNQFNFLEQVFDILDFTGANPRLLKLELTEGFSIKDIEDVIAKMTCLKQRGVGISLDDFGTGYSSLSYLKRLPLEQLKIDQSFVRDILIDPNDAAISKMVIVLADSLGLTVIAEGVETEEQRYFLESQGCYKYQGYLFSHPLPIWQFEEYAKNII
jgi:diguanylate cyclase (GGDEF)-like protein/PAS domain S-box-containing protein